MVIHGEVNYDDSIQQYLPEKVIVPIYEGKEVTLQHLATHSAGFPEDPDNNNASGLWDTYGDYTIEL